MAWRFHGRARVNSHDPRAFGTCDRCGIWYNLNELRFQYDWRGNRMMNLNFRVCRKCYDKPFEHYRPIIVPPDPVPKMFPRPDLYAPFMANMVQDPLGNDVLDPRGQFLQAPGAPLPVPYISPDAATGVINAIQADRYKLRAPTGGPVIILPE